MGKEDRTKTKPNNLAKAMQVPEPVTARLVSRTGHLWAEQLRRALQLSEYASMTGCADTAGLETKGIQNAPACMGQKALQPTPGWAGYKQADQILHASPERGMAVVWHGIGLTGLVSLMLSIPPRTGMEGSGAYEKGQGCLWS